jgi:hypothetical protein
MAVSEDDESDLQGLWNEIKLLEKEREGFRNALEQVMRVLEGDSKNA